MFIISKTLRKLSRYIQQSHTSFERHNAEYTQAGKLQIERDVAAKYRSENVFNGQTSKLATLLTAHPGVRIWAVDIGSGAGWCSAELAHYFKQVIAIEPSQSAVAIAKQLYPQSLYPNIVWNIGMAEHVLPTLEFTAPVVFVTSVVFSHLRDAEVRTICKQIDTMAPSGSLLSFNETWGPSWHQNMWHVRTQAWWQQQLPSWNLDFHGPQLSESPKYNRGIHGIKRG